MIDPAVLDAMVDSGCSAEQIAAVVKAALASCDERKAAKRANNAERQRRFRERNADNALRGVTNAQKVSPLCPPDKDPPRPPEINPPISPRPSCTAGAVANDISARMPELYAALGVTDETKTPGLLSISEPINWTVAGCDIDADILPTLRSMAARGKVPRSWSYCTNAVFEARDRRLAPAPAVQPQHRQAAPPSKPRTVAELAIHRLRTGDFRNDHSSNSDRFLGAGDGPGQDQSARILELAAIAAHGRR